MAISVFDFRDKVNSLTIVDLMLQLIQDIEADNTGEALQQLQWQKGEDRYGSILGIYTRATEIVSKGRKKAGEPYNLFDTGSFWNETYLKAEISGNDIVFSLNSKDSKTPILIEKMGDRIFGLADENMPEFSESVMNLLINNLNKITN